MIECGRETNLIFGLGVTLITLTLFSYFVQFKKMYQAQSSLSLSFKTFSLITLTSLFNFFNLLGIQYQEASACCSQSSLFVCVSTFLSFFLFFLTWLLSVLILFCISYYYYKTRNDNVQVIVNKKDFKEHEISMLSILLIIFVHLSFAVTLLVIWIMKGLESSRMENFAK